MVDGIPDSIKVTTIPPKVRRSGKYPIDWRTWSVFKTPLDATHDLSDNQVIVFTDYPVLSPQVVDEQVTYPLALNQQ